MAEPLALHPDASPGGFKAGGGPWNPIAASEAPRVAEPLALRNLTGSRGRRFDALVADGRLWLRRNVEGVRAIDARGGRLLPGLADHHVHLMATAAVQGSLDLSGLALPEALDRLRAAARNGPVRAIGLDGAERLDAALLDRIAGDVPVRVQARTGGLWVLNRAALAELGPPGALPPAFEREAGVLTGRVWRGDGFLRRAGPPPDLAALGAELARHGVTAVTDASVTTDAAQAGAIAAAGLPQRLTLMSGGPLPEDPRWQVGPLKLVPDERGLPSPEAMAGRIEEARVQGRYVAVHCVTHAELAVTLAAFATAGAMPGDRIEHGALIGAEAVPVIAALGLTVAANPGFVHARGDRWLRQVPPEDLPDLCRLASLRAAGIPLLAGSDAPYGPLDPWQIIRAACTRRTAHGAPLGPAEALEPEQALALHLPAAGPDPADGGLADLTILRPGAALTGPDPVQLTLIGGTMVYSRAPLPHPAPVPGAPA